MPATNDQQIFLIDEDDIVRDSLKVLLESHGMPVWDYRNAAEFLAETGTPRAGCLILGYNRAIANGLDLIATLRRRGITMPVIFIVGGGDATTRSAVLAACAGDGQCTDDRRNCHERDACGHRREIVVQARFGYPPPDPAGAPLQ